MIGYRIPSFLLAAVILSGCGKSTDDLEVWVAEVKARKAVPIEPIPQMKQYEAFTYEAGTRRDPFSVPASEQNRASESSPRPDLSRNKEPLEEFPIDALRMVGTINTKGNTYALIKAPDGVVHRVTTNNHLGQNYGRIVGISESEVSLMELVPDGFGGWLERAATIALTQQQ